MAIKAITSQVKYTFSIIVPSFILGPKEFDSRTFTRSKKRHPFELPVVDGEVSVKDDALHGSCTPPLSDLIDIHTLARLQEESKIFRHLKLC